MDPTTDFDFLGVYRISSTMFLANSFNDNAVAIYNVSLNKIVKVKDLLIHGQI